MRLNKNQFLIVVAVMFAVAAVVAWQIKSMAASDPALSPDLAFLMLWGMVVMFCLRAEFWAGAFWATYGGSLLFCFVYVLIAPLEAPLVLLLFLGPAILWQRKQIGCWPMLAIAAALMALSYKVLGRPGLFLLLMPTCHVVAMRLAARVQTRYSRLSVDQSATMSQIQREQQGLTSAGTADWFDLLQTEMEAIPARLHDFWADLRGEKSRHDPEDERGLDPRLMQLQNAGLMSRALTDLCRRDPRFAADRFVKRVEEGFWKIQHAWYGQALDSIAPLVGDALFEQFRMQIDDQKACGIRYEAGQMTIFDNRIVQVNSDRNFDVIHVFVRASSADKLIDLKTGKTIAEEQERRQFSEYWSFLRRPSAQTLEKPGLLEGACPNCGAPLEIGQNTVCGSCGSYIRSGTHDWVLARITHASEWEYTEPQSLPGWRDIVAADKNFTVQQIEDRGGVMFWMLRLAERQQRDEPLRRYATATCCEQFARRLGAFSRGWTYMDNIALGSVGVRGIRCDSEWDRLYLLVAWRGIPVRVDAKGSAIAGSRMPRVVRDVFVLVRRHGQQTDERTTLSSAHCPGCGAPLASAFTVACEYCNLILNEGTAGWILERITHEGDPEYLDLRRRPAAATPTAVDEEDGERRSAADVLTVMAQVLLADGKIDDREMKLLREMAARYHVSDARLEGLIAALSAGEVHVPAPADQTEAWTLLESAARMALADNELTPEEERTLTLLGQFLGYSKADVQRAIKKEQKRLFDLAPKPGYQPRKK